MAQSAASLQARLNVTFMGEEGVDAGGVSREWYLILSREIFNPNYGLFIPSADSSTFQPSPTSAVNPDHLQYFKFVGRVIGKAIADGQLLDAFFTRSFYKHMLNIPVEFQVIFVASEIQN
jgi:E3 ubiquitin-protein ligase HUWE1